MLKSSILIRFNYKPAVSMSKRVVYAVQMKNRVMMKIFIYSSPGKSFLLCLQDFWCYMIAVERCCAFRGRMVSGRGVLGLEAAVLGADIVHLGVGDRGRVLRRFPSCCSVLVRGTSQQLNENISHVGAGLQARRTVEIVQHTVFFRWRFGVHRKSRSTSVSFTKPR